MEKKNDISLKIVMLPWLGHGHISPFLELGKKLITLGNFKVYLCSTPANLSSSVKGELPENLQVIELHLPESDILPASLHTTNGLPPNLMSTLKIAFEKGKSNFERILLSYKPDLVIYDALQPWAPEAASKLNIPAVNFIANGVTMSAFMFQSSKNPGMEFPFPEIYYRDYEREIAKTNKKLECCPNDLKRNWVTECIDRSSKIVLIKSISEIESKYISYLSLLSGKKVIPVGPLVVPTPDHVDENNSDNIILQWLNKKEKKSTVFVAFGSEFFLEEQDRLNLARGLELSGVNFIWVIRSPKGEKLDLEKALPEGFFQRVGEKGRILEGWAPQAQILSHPSIGGFVSHCGWGSVLESIQFGVPIIAIPMHLDQPINSRLVKHVGIGVEAVKDEKRKIQSKELAAVIRRVMIDESGQDVRRNMEILKKKIEAKGDEDIDVVVHELLKLCEAKRVTYLPFSWKFSFIINKIVNFLKFLF